jgi:hypothetical protein
MTRKDKGRVAVLAVALLAGFGCGGGGCGGAGGGQSQECRDYIACFRKIAGTSDQDGGPMDLEKTYEAGGSCWSGVAAMAQSCTATCKSTLETLRMQYPGAGC